MNTTIVKQANAAFRQRDYSRAKRLYQQAAAHYGGSLFEANLTLCERRLQSPSEANASVLSQSGGDSSAVSRQLAETQKLLEQYFARCQELEHQLMDR
jgi:hypothetical protein